jgi:lysozyme family protein
MGKSVTIRGGGQKPTSVDLQIQTNFTVKNDGCVGATTVSGVSCTPGTILLVNVKAGNGPMPTSCTWQGAPISTDKQSTISCPAALGELGKLICDNKLNGGKDVDRMTITVQ